MQIRRGGEVERYRKQNEECIYDDWNIQKKRKVNTNLHKFLVILDMTHN